jgi:dihydropteroate synthase
MSKSFSWEQPHPMIMGILNCTPDSFSDGGLYHDTQSAIAHAERMWQHGANIIDIGGESSRPGAQSISVEEELERVIPVVKALKKAYPERLISVDTVKPEVAEESVWHGADIINDINGLQNKKLFHKVVELHQKYQTAVVIMHMRGTPQSMQLGDLENPMLFEEIKAFLKNQVHHCVAHGIDPRAIAIDPGLGFGKTVDQNLELLARIDELKEISEYILIGASRKSFLGTLCQKEKDQRLIASISAAVLAIWEGARIIRVHDVDETRDAVKIVEQCLKFKKKSHRI